MWIAGNRLTENILAVRFPSDARNAASCELLVNKRLATKSYETRPGARMSSASAVSAATVLRQKANVVPPISDATFATRKGSKKFGGLSTKNRKNGIALRAGIVVVNSVVV